MMVFYPPPTGCIFVTGEQDFGTQPFSFCFYIRTEDFTILSDSNL